MPGLTQAYTTYRPTCYVHYSVGTVVQTSPGPHSRPTRSYTFIKYSYNFHHPPLPTPTALCENLVSLLNSVLYSIVEYGTLCSIVVIPPLKFQRAGDIYIITPGGTKPISKRGLITFN